jgi:hypothetical protein
MIHIHFKMNIDDHDKNISSYIVCVRITLEYNNIILSIIPCEYGSKRGLRGRLVTTADFQPRAPFNLCEGAFQLDCGTSSVVYLRCPFRLCLKYFTMGNLKTPSISKAGKSIYNLFCVGVT